MANKTIKYDSFKRGDTPVFYFEFTEPVSGFDWTGITVDAAITSVESPSNNAGAAVSRIDAALVIDPSTNIASFELQPTVSESNSLTPDTTYKVEVQLKDDGGENVATAVTGEVKILQDWVI